MDDKILNLYNTWKNSEFIDEADREDLRSIEGNQEEIESRFYKEIEFGTAGIRGIRGIGTNRINKYMVRKATQGLANYMLEVDAEESKKKGVVIAYDCRIGSTEYALNTALVLAANGIKAYLFESLRSTPELSFAVRELGAQAGIVITASHNPVEYNGYKVYWNDGAQIVEPHAGGIIGNVAKITDLSMIKTTSEEKAKSSGLLNIIGKEQDDRYIEAIKKQILNSEIEGKKDFKIVYTPLHGTGRVAVQRVLSEAGFESVYTVASQEMPDGTFPTCAYANPEDPSVFKLGIELADEKGATIVMANDPDADRIGIAVKDKDGAWTYPNGNQMGLLIMNYILENKKDIPENGTVISTVVSTPMLNPVAKDRGVKLIRTLTGFKYIGEKIKNFEEKILDGTYLFGFEESYGYLIGTHARDKDAVVTSMIIAEMAAKYQEEGTSIPEKLEELYKKYGYYKDGITAITKSGKSGAEEISALISNLRENTPSTLADKKVVIVRDFKLKVEKNLVEGTEVSIDLPSSNVLQFVLEDETYITVRPSGTEPKIKYYYGVKGKTAKEAEEKLAITKEKFEGSL